MAQVKTLKIIKANLHFLFCCPNKSAEIQKYLFIFIKSINLQEGTNILDILLFFDGRGVKKKRTRWRVRECGEDAVTCFLFFLKPGSSSCDCYVNISLAGVNGVPMLVVVT